MEHWPTIQLESSNIVPFEIDHCWPFVRNFGEVWKIHHGLDMGGAVQPVRSRMLGDVPGTCVGGQRSLEVGDMRLIQQLDAVDDEEHVLKWHAVDHPLNRWQPPGSFINDHWSMSMTPVSMSNATYLVMSGKFLTEPQNVVAMTAFIENMLDSAVAGVARSLQAAAQRDLAGQLPQQVPPPHSSWPAGQQPPGSHPAAAPAGMFAYAQPLDQAPANISSWMNHSMEYPAPQAFAGGGLAPGMVFPGQANFPQVCGLPAGYSRVPHRAPTPSSSMSSLRSQPGTSLSYDAAPVSQDYSFDHLMGGLGPMLHGNPLMSHPGLYAAAGMSHPSALYAGGMGQQMSHHMSHPGPSQPSSAKSQQPQMNMPVSQAASQMGEGPAVSVTSASPAPGQQ